MSFIVNKSIVFSGSILNSRSDKGDVIANVVAGAVPTGDWAAGGLWADCAILVTIEPPELWLSIPLLNGEILRSVSESHE